MSFENINSRHAAIAPVVYGMLGGAYMTLLDSISSGEPWRIVFAVSGFLGFVGLASIYTYGLYRLASEQEV